MAGKTLIEMISIKIYIFELMVAIFCFLKRAAIKKLAAAKVAVENSMAFLERAAVEKRVAARVAVGFFGICLSIGGLVALFLPILSFSLGSPWFNVLYIAVFVFGALIFQFAREDFDRD